MERRKEERNNLQIEDDTKSEIRFATTISLLLRLQGIDSLSRL